MISPRVPSAVEIHECLRELGFSETDQRTKTGQIWKHEKSGKHFLVPQSVEGHYPEWIFDEFLLKAETISGTRLKTWPGFLARPETRD